MIFRLRFYRQRAHTPSPRDHGPPDCARRPNSTCRFSIGINSHRSGCGQRPHPAQAIGGRRTRTGGGPQERHALSGGSARQND